MSPSSCHGCGAPLGAGVRFCPQCGMSTSGPLAQRPANAGPALPSTRSPGRALPTLTSGTDLDGRRYRISRLLNAGSFGAVYEASNARLGGQPCAIKELLNPPGQSRAEQAESEAWFQREAALL